MPVSTCLEQCFSTRGRSAVFPSSGLLSMSGDCFVTASGGTIGGRGQGCC